MVIQHRLYDTQLLLGMMEHIEQPSNYFLDSFFTRTILSDQQYINFEKMGNSRKLAPLVVPTAQGKPIYSRASKVQQFQPAYIKVKDALVPTDVIKKLPGQLASNVMMSPQARKDILVNDMLRQHLEAIARREEFMAAEAIIKGQISLVDDSYPDTGIISFERDPGHSIILTGLTRWDQSGSDILGNLIDWARLMTIAQHGGSPTRITFGANAWTAFVRDPETKEQLDTQMRGTNATFTTGLTGQNDVVFKGTYGGMELYLYQGYYTDENDVSVPLMSPDEVLLSSNNVMGIRAYGAIFDFDSLNVQQRFTKMWPNEDPSVEYVMTQTAPLMIPMNPNATLRAKVVN